MHPAGIPVGQGDRTPVPVSIRDQDRQAWRGEHPFDRETLTGSGPQVCAAGGDACPRSERLPERERLVPWGQDAGALHPRAEEWPRGSRVHSGAAGPDIMFRRLPRSEIGRSGAACNQRYRRREVAGLIIRDRVRRTILHEFHLHEFRGLVAAHPGSFFGVLLGVARCGTEFTAGVYGQLGTSRRKPERRSRTPIVGAVSLSASSLFVTRTAREAQCMQAVAAGGESRLHFFDVPEKLDRGLDEPAQRIAVRDRV